MNEQLMKLAEKLNKGIDNIPVMYESLRTQYMIYHVANVLSDFFGTLAGVGLFTGIFLLMAERYGELVDEDDRPFIRRAIKIQLTIGVIALILVVGCRVTLYMYAPDIVMLDGLRK